MNLQVVPKFKKYNKTLSQVFFVSVPPPRYHERSYDHAQEQPFPVRPYKPKKMKKQVQIKQTVYKIDPRPPSKSFFSKSRKESYSDSDKRCGLSKWCRKEKALQDFKKARRLKQYQAKNIHKWKFEDAARLRQAEIEEARLRREAEYVRQIEEIEKQKKKLARDKLKTYYPKHLTTKDPYTEYIDLTHEDTVVIMPPPQRKTMNILKRFRKDKFQKEKQIKLKRQKDVSDIPHKCGCNLVKLKQYVTRSRKKEKITPISDIYGTTTTKRLKKEKKVKSSKPVPKTSDTIFAPNHENYKPKNYEYDYTPKKYEEYTPKKYEDQFALYYSDPYKSFRETEGKPKKNSKKTESYVDPFSTLHKDDKKTKNKDKRLTREKSVNIDKRPPPESLSRKFVNCFYRTCCQCCCWFSFLAIVSVAVIVYV